MVHIITDHITDIAGVTDMTLGTDGIMTLGTGDITIPGTEILGMRDIMIRGSTTRGIVTLGTAIITTGITRHIIRHIIRSIIRFMLPPAETLFTATGTAPGWHRQAEVHLPPERGTPDSHALLPEV